MLTLLTGGMSLGKATVIVDIVAKGNSEIRPEYYMDPSKVAVHNTGNTGKGADAKAHNTYIHNMAELPESATGYASWHFSVDEYFIYQHLPLSESAWHTGDGAGTTSGNRTAIGIEICIHSDQKNYAQAEENAIALIKWLLDNCDISVGEVKPHQYFSGKYCPSVILKRDGSFTKFHNRVKTAISEVTTVSNPVTTSTYKAFSPVRIGQVTADIWTQETSTYSPYRRVKVLHKGESYKVYGEDNGFYNVGTQWVSKNYMTLTGTVGITQLGTIEIVNVSNACYVVDKPSSTGSIIGTVKLGTRLPIAGSVTGWYEVIYNGERAYVNAKYCKLV